MGRVFWADVDKGINHDAMIAVASMPSLNFIIALL